MAETEAKSVRFSFPLWKGFWLIAVPVAAIYQLVWSGVFHFQPELGRPTQYVRQIISFKLASEIGLYSAVLWLFNRYTHSESKTALITANAAVTIVLCLTVFGFLKSVASH